jgi:hypothetical protein
MAYVSASALNTFNNVIVNGATALNNLSVSGTVTATNVSATNFNTSNINVTGTLNAPNLVSSIKAGVDEFHYPTPTGPFAVDIIPMRAHGIKNTLELFGSFSNQWYSVDESLGGNPDGSITINTDIDIVIYAPSNRTNKSVSASLTGTDNIDSSNSNFTLAVGANIYHPDDFIFNQSFISNFSFATTQESQEYYSLLTDLSNLFNTITPQGPIAFDSSNASLLKNAYDAIKATNIYQKISNSFSIQSGKIYHNTQSDISGNIFGYKKFNQTPFTGDGILDSSGDNATYYNTSYNASSNLPNSSELLAELGSTQCPIVIIQSGDGGQSLAGNPGLAQELASHGYIVVQLASFLSASQYKWDTNQTVYDCLVNGYLGNTGDYNPFCDISGNFRLFNVADNGSWWYNGNMNDPNSTLGPYNLDALGTFVGPFGSGASGINKLILPDASGNTTDASGNPILYYTDVNGNSNYFTDNVRVTTALQNHRSISHNGSNYNPIAYEKNMYVVKQLMIKAGFTTERVNYDNIGSEGHSSGGWIHSFLNQMAVTSSDGLGNDTGYTSYLKDSSNLPIHMFTTKCIINKEMDWLAAQRENLGVIFKNINYGLNYSDAEDNVFNGGQINFSSDTAIGNMPTGFNVPALCFFTSSPTIFFATTPYFGNVGLLSESESIQYILAKTRVYNQNVLQDSVMVSYPAKEHVNLNYAFGIPSNQQDGNGYGDTIAFMWSDGWFWPEQATIDQYLYTNKHETQTESRLKHYLTWYQLSYLWYDRYLKTGSDVTLNEIVRYGNMDSFSCMGSGATEAPSCEYIDPIYRYIGTHKIGNSTDSSGGEHLNIDFGKNQINENAAGCLEIDSRTSSVVASVGTSDHKFPIYINGVKYNLLMELA